VNGKQVLGSSKAFPGYAVSDSQDGPDSDLVNGKQVLGFSTSSQDYYCESDSVNGKSLFGFSGDLHGTKESDSTAHQQALGFSNDSQDDMECDSVNGKPKLGFSSGSQDSKGHKVITRDWAELVDSESECDQDEAECDPMMGIQVLGTGMGSITDKIGKGGGKGSSKDKKGKGAAVGKEAAEFLTLMCDAGVRSRERGDSPSDTTTVMKSYLKDGIRRGILQPELLQAWRATIG
jgi:hypothetical protein